MRTSYSRASSEEGENFFLPTLLTCIGQQSSLFREETFGPVAGLTSFDGKQQAISLANATSAGFAAYFYARDTGVSCV